MILALIVALIAQAATIPAGLQEKWSAPIKDGSPVAAFYDVSSKSIFVSVDEGSTARVDQFDVNGKLLKAAVAKAKGSAGPMRAHFGKIYWVGGDLLWRLDPANGKKEKLAEIPTAFGKAVDLTVDRQGTIYMGLSGGTLYQLTGSTGSVVIEGKPITGLFLLDATLFILRETKLESYTPSDKKALSQPLCKTACSGLEKNSAGDWLTVEGQQIRHFRAKGNRVLFEAKEALGRIAYVYERDPKDDSLIIPFPASRTLRAYRFP